ncbi:hypothetical protein BDZ97DRAFT_1380609 [Flammula alnicola]|nr:hypothetical protein BDZ97DRAFT_1380609 [Flammula alnicola]
MTDLRGVDINIERRLLQAEEVRLTAALSSVRSKLNELLPISWLPPEILEEIFDICVSWLYGHQKPKHRLAWTQVCCSWRRISLNSSRLWQRIDLCDSRFADEFLVRSKQAPLSIVSASPLKLMSNNLNIHAARLRSIDVFLFPDDMAHLFSSIGRNLLTLTSLSLKIPPVSSTLSLGLSLPLVRRLILDCVTVQWESCRNLTHLSLRGLNPEVCPSVSELHDLFAKSPNLEYVRLENLMPSISHPESSRFIPLAHLKDMIISAQPFVASAVLSGVYIGPRARLQLYLPLSEDLHTLFPKGLPYLLNHHHQLDVGTIRLSRHSAHFLRHSTNAWSEESTKTIFSISSAPPLSARVCASLDHLLDLACVTKLELNTGVLLDIPLKVLDNLFANLCNLQALCVAFNDLEDLLGILQAFNPSTSQLYFPLLTKLSFSKPSDLWWHFNDRWMTSIFECLETRRFHSVPIQKIEFFRCHGISPTCAKTLKAIVPQVIIYEEIRNQRPF